jgi:hypothetical protein
MANAIKESNSRSKTMPDKMNFFDFEILKQHSQVLYHPSQSIARVRYCTFAMASEVINNHAVVLGKGRSDTGIPKG